MKAYRHEFGVDGYTFMYKDPIQVKQQERVSRPEIDKFTTAVRREDKSKGLFIAFSFTSGSYEEEARQADQEGIEVELITVSGISSRVMGSLTIEGKARVIACL